MQKAFNFIFAIVVVFAVILFGLEFHEWLVEQTSPLGTTIVFCFITSLITIAFMAILTRE